MGHRSCLDSCRSPIETANSRCHATHKHTVTTSHHHDQPEPKHKISSNLKLRDPCIKQSDTNIAADMRNPILRIHSPNTRVSMVPILRDSSTIRAPLSLSADSRALADSAAAVMISEQMHGVVRNHDKMCCSHTNTEEMRKTHTRCHAVGHGSQFFDLGRICRSGSRRNYTIQTITIASSSCSRTGQIQPMVRGRQAVIRNLQQVIKLASALCRCIRASATLTKANMPCSSEYT